MASVSPDVLVLGSGLAGFAAAVALKQKGKNVAVLSRAAGASSVSSGAWDFGPIVSDASLAEHFASAPWKKIYSALLCDHPPVVEEIETAVKEVAAGLDKELPIAFSFSKPFCLPTSQGHWKRTFGAHELQARADRDKLRGKKVGLVSSEKWRFRADLISRRLELGETKLALNQQGGDWSLAHVATRLKHQRAFREEMFEAARRSVQNAKVDVLLFPPLLLDLEFADALQKELGITVAECLSTVEPVAGQRLATAIQASLNRHQIPFHFVRQLQAEVADGNVKALQLLAKGAEGWETVPAKHYVLATGKYFGGGLDLGYETLTETLFDLPLFIAKDYGVVRRRSELPWRDQPFNEDQAWAKLGVWVDGNMRPVDGGRRPALGNVRACGSLVGGVDFARESVGMGYMAYSGRICGNQGS